MKLRTFLNCFVILVILFTTLSKLNAQMNLKGKGQIGAINIEGALYSPSQVNYNYYDQMNFTINHQYLHQWDWKFQSTNGGIKYGGFYDNILTYISEMNNVFYNSYHRNNGTGQSLILERFKTNLAAYGQRSTYQVEKFSNNGNLEIVKQNPGYGYIYSDFNDAVDNTQNPPVKGKHCQPGIDNYLPTNYIAKGLYENNEQTNCPNDAINFSDIKNPDITDYRFYIKPRMRIPVSEIGNLEKDVVIIEIYGYDGQLIGQPVTIKVKDFLDAQGNYDERYYQEMFFQNPPIPPIYPLSVTGLQLNNGTRGAGTVSQVDYRIKWCGQVDVWVDYVRVDDEWAHFLFNPSLENPANPLAYKFPERISQEVNNFKLNDGFGLFYSDEFQINNVDCIAEVKRLIELASAGKTTLVPMLNHNMLSGRYNIKHEQTQLKNFVKFDDATITDLVSRGLFTDFVLHDPYAFKLNDNLRIRYPHNLTFNDPGHNLDIAGLYEDNQANSSAVYNEDIQTVYETFSPVNGGLNDSYYTSFMGSYRLLAKALQQSILQNKDFVFANVVQAHSFESSPDYILREPTNEEISLQAYLGLAYGAKQTMYYQFQTSKWGMNKGRGFYANYGLLNFDGTPRTSNVYKYYNDAHQDKWNSVVNLNAKIKQIYDYMYPESNKNKHLIYDDTRTVNTFPGIINKPGYVNVSFGLPFKYISDLQSVMRDQSAVTYNLNLQDENAKRYWEIGFFKNNPANTDNAEQFSKYFIALNKRCTPETPGNIYDGDVRRLRLKFNPSELPNFNNWVLIDPLTNTTITTINKNSTGFYDVGEFQPGEGKLFKLAPVMQEGGTLVCDEEVTPTTFVCDNTVYNNGYNLTLYQGTTIKFKDNKGKIVFNGGSFYSGIIPQNANIGVTEFISNSGTWEGISFAGNSNIYVSNSVFKNIAYEPPEGENPTIQNCAISLINCNNFRIQSSEFNIDNKAGAIYYQYNDDFNPNWQNTYIASNRFLVTNSNNPIVTSFNSLSAIQMPLRIEGNFFDNNTGSSATAIIINGISGGSIKNNTIHKFNNGIIAFSSSVDLFSNYIYSNTVGAKSIQGLNSSNINISPSEPYYFGGYNRIKTMNNESKNIFLENSFVFLQNGDNHFNISSYSGSENKPYHIYGTFPSSNGETYPAGFNCFNIDSVNSDPVVEVTAGGNPVEFYFYSYSCNAMLTGDFEVFTNPGIVNDTIAVKYLGAGGSEKGTGESKSEVQISPCKSLMDSINISLRKRQYQVAESKCKRMLTLYSDSTACFDALNKLYLASLSQDSAGIKMGTLKAFYETVILNNQGKVNLVNRCFYLIQKCKVALKQYSSALDGFQLIMQQNPYTYEGLSASWDYAATHLLDSIHGSSGAYSIILEEKQLTVFDLTDRYDSTKFTKKQRNDISKTVNDILESKRITQTEKIIDLQKKSNEGNKEAAKELKVMKVLNETVKKKTPNTHIELAQIIQNDIKKVFGSKSENTKETPSILPITYALYQNYPNPFNPTTKIAYDIPRDAKVKLVIYDILGREMKTLVNNEFRSAGKYITEFNGSNLASGIYFARILVNEGKEFMAVKKMMLLK